MPVTEPVRVTTDSIHLQGVHILAQSFSTFQRIYRSASSRYTYFYVFCLLAMLLAEHTSVTTPGLEPWTSYTPDKCSINWTMDTYDPKTKMVIASLLVDLVSMNNV